MKHDADLLYSGDLAPDVNVTNQNGLAVQLSGFWHGGPLLLVFLRHFG